MAASPPVLPEQATRRHTGGTDSLTIDQLLEADLADLRKLA
ncbi:hypothetical protein [Arthrobacter sp. 260]|nr:hypothetical protein [Arthrobacter sp. 260]